MTFTTTTAREIIDTARTRHWAFTDLQMGDGAVLLNLRTALRTNLATHGGAIEGLVNTTLTYSLVTYNGLLVAEFTPGIPYITSTYQDGWAIHPPGLPPSAPYVDFAEPPIAVDPYGLHGGTPGFPLPESMIRLIDVSLVYNNPPGLTIPCDVIQEHGRLDAQPGRNPQVFVSGNRLVPLFPFQGAASNPNSGDRWFSASAIIISFVIAPTLLRLDDTLNLPTVLLEALVSDLAELLGYQSKLVTVAERKQLADMAARTRSTMAAAGLAILETPEMDMVDYRG